MAGISEEKGTEFVSKFKEFLRRKYYKDMVKAMQENRALVVSFQELDKYSPEFGEMLLKSPFTQRDCVYYRYKVEEYRSSGKHSHWVTIKSGEYGIPFYITDNTGHVLVDPTGAKIEIARDAEFRSGTGRDPPISVQQFCAANSIRWEGAIFGINKTMRYREHFISPNDMLYVMGTAADNPYVEDGSAIRSSDDIMIQKGSSEDPYKITDSSEKEIISTLKWKIAGGVLGGMALITACLIGIVLVMGI